MFQRMIIEFKNEMSYAFHVLSFIYFFPSLLRDCIISSFWSQDFLSIIKISCAFRKLKFGVPSAENFD